MASFQQREPFQACHHAVSSLCCRTNVAPRAPPRPARGRRLSRDRRDTSGSVDGVAEVRTVPRTTQTSTVIRTAPRSLCTWSARTYRLEEGTQPDKDVALHISRSVFDLDSHISRTICLVDICQDCTDTFVCAILRRGFFFAGNCTARWYKLSYSHDHMFLVMCLSRTGAWRAESPCAGAEMPSVALGVITSRMAAHARRSILGP